MEVDFGRSVGNRPGLRPDRTGQCNTIGNFLLTGPFPLRAFCDRHDGKRRSAKRLDRLHEAQALELNQEGNGIAARAAAMAVVCAFIVVHFERRRAFFMEWAEANHLARSAPFECRVTARDVRHVMSGTSLGNDALEIGIGQAHQAAQSVLAETYSRISRA